jgi:translocation protein SEC66
VMEANAYKEGWGQIIFNTANEMVNHDRVRERSERVAADAAEERKWWDEKRARSTRELLGEEGTSDSDGVIVENVKKAGKGKGKK